MRLAPLPIYYQDNPELAIQMCESQSRTTHEARECLAACRVLGEALIRALQGKLEEEALADFPQAPSMSSALKQIATDHCKDKSESEIRGSGYVLDSLEAALWCFWHTDSFRKCVRFAANLGDDVDTTAAIAGQLAGAFHGESGIPAAWLQMLTITNEIGQLAEELSRPQIGEIRS